MIECGQKVGKGSSGVMVKQSERMGAGMVGRQRDGERQIIDHLEVGDITVGVWGVNPGLA